MAIECSHDYKAYEPSIIDGGDDCHGGRLFDTRPLSRYCREADGSKAELIDERFGGWGCNEGACCGVRRAAWRIAVWRSRRRRIDCAHRQCVCRRPVGGAADQSAAAFGSGRVRLDRLLHRRPSGLRRGFVGLVVRAGGTPARSISTTRSICSKGPAAICSASRSAMTAYSPRAGSSASRPTYLSRVFPRIQSAARRPSARRRRGLRTTPNRPSFWHAARPRRLCTTGNWLFYATGGFAWSYDQFTRHTTRRRPGRRHRDAGNGGEPVHGAARRRRDRRRGRSRTDAELDSAA